MARSKLEKAKGRRETGPYFALPMSVMRSPQFSELSPRAVKAFLAIASQFRGNNNGDLSAAFSVMRDRGWTSKDQLAKAVAELVEQGFLVVTRRGGNRVARLYAITFLAIDPSEKYDDGIRPTIAPPGTWKKSRDHAAGRNGPSRRVKNPKRAPLMARASGHNSSVTGPVMPRTAGPFLVYQGLCPEAGTGTKPPGAAAVDTKALPPSLNAAGHGGARLRCMLMDVKHLAAND